jgi:hypothetical protein
MMNNLKHNEDGDENGITEINSKSIKSECENTMLIKIWTRNCPECGKEIFHSRRDHRNYFQKINARCKSCSKKSENNPQYGKLLTDVCRKKISNRLKGKVPRNIELILWRNHHKIFTNDTRYKMRLSRIKYLQSCLGQIFPTYNKVACNYFSLLDKQRGWNGQYATNGGEYFIRDLGYWVDYYEPMLNIVIEYDEPKHYRNGKLLERDIRRMKEIQNFLKCDFYRYKEETKELKKYE